MRESSIIVAGANGMLGSAVVERLLDTGRRVIGLYRLGARMSRPLPIPNTMFQAVEVRAIELAMLTGALSGSGADTIVNCTGAGVDPAHRDSDSLWKGNVKPIAELVSFAAATGISRVIHTGSEAEYAHAITGQRITEMHPVLPFSEYGAAKAASVCYAAALAQTFGVQLAVLRPFYMFGPGERGHRLLPSIAAAKASGRSVAMSQGEQQRDFLHVDDVAAAYNAIIDIDWSGQITVYNVCSGHARTIRDVAEVAAKMFGLSTGALNWGGAPARETDAPWIVGDPSRIEYSVDWHPSLTLEQGIERWIRSAARCRSMGATA